MLANSHFLANYMYGRSIFAVIDELLDAESCRFSDTIDPSGPIEIFLNISNCYLRRVLLAHRTERNADCDRTNFL